MHEDFDGSFEESNDHDRLIKLEDMFSDSAYYYFDVSEWESMIDHYLSSLKLEKAIRALSFAKNQHPASLELTLKEAELLAEKNENRSAIALLKKMEVKYPYEADIPAMLGGIYSKIEMGIKAIFYYKKALGLCEQEEKSDIIFQMVSEYMMLNKPNQAIYWLKGILKEDPKNIEALYEIALTFENNELFDEAILYFKKYLEDYPFSHHAWFNLGNLLTGHNKLEEALEAFDYAIVAYEEFSSGWYNKGTILLRLGRYKLALEALLKTLDLEGPSAPTYCRIAEIYENDENYDQALHYYEKTLEQNEIYFEARVGAANSALEVGELKKALKYIETAIKQDEENAQAMHIYAEVCQSLQFFEEAKKAYKKVIHLDPENWEVFLDYSAILFEQDEKENAIFIIESGMVLTGNECELALRAGAYQYLVGNCNQAFQLWNTGLMNNPQGIEQIFEFDQELRCIPEIFYRAV